MAASIYLLIARPWVQKFNTLPQFYFQPGLETAADFLIRNLWNLFNTFSPLLIGSPPAAAALVLGFVALVFLASVLDSPREVSSSDRALPAAILTALLAIVLLPVSLWLVTDAVATLPATSFWTSSRAITGDVYGHTSDDAARAAVDGLAGRLGI